MSIKINCINLLCCLFISTTLFHSRVEDESTMVHQSELSEKVDLIELRVQLANLISTRTSNDDRLLKVFEQLAKETEDNGYYAQEFFFNLGNGSPLIN